MSSSNGESNEVKWTVVGCRVTEEELHNVLTPIMHDCYDLGLIKHDTVSSFVKFCINFWIAHYRMKKQEFEMRQQEIEQEKKKLAAIEAEKAAYEKSTRHVIQQATKKVEEMGEELEREFAETHPSSSPSSISEQQQPKPKQQASSKNTSRLANLSLEDMMA
jgi:hypothetical protein